MALKFVFNPLTAQFDLVQDLTGYIKGSDVPSFEADTLDTVTDRGATTPNRVTTGNLTVTDDGSASVTVNAVPAGLGGLDSQTAFLWHFDGSLVDENGNGTTATTLITSGTTALSSDWKAFGTQSLKVPANGYAYFTDMAKGELGAGDFELDCRVNFIDVTTTATHQIFSHYKKDVTNLSYAFQWVRATQKLRFLYSTDGANFITLTASSTWLPTVGVDYWIGVSRSGNNLYFWVDDIQIGTAQVISGTLYNGSGDYVIGAGTDGSNWINSGNFYIDEFRLSVGTNRGLTSAWSKPTVPYFRLVPYPQIILKGSGVQKAIIETDGADSDTIKLIDKDNVKLVDIKQTTGNTTFKGDISAPNLEDYKTYSGFENRTGSTIAINASGVFTLAPVATSFNVYANGRGKLTIATTQTVTVTADQTITFIYVDHNGVLQKSTTPWDLSSGLNAPCAIIFKDGTSYAITDERHGYERNKAWHKWAHNNIGAMYHYGLTGTFTSTTLSITQGEIADEDINFDTLATKTACTLWYRNATTGMRMIRGSSTPFYAPAGVLKYDNGTGTLANVGNNKYTTMWFYCSNDATEPIYAVIGQNDDTLLSAAQNATRPVINLSTAEWKLIYRVIFRNSSGTATYIESADFRSVQTGVPASVGLPTNHASLTGRDLPNSHPISAITDGVSTDQTTPQTITGQPRFVTSGTITRTAGLISAYSIGARSITINRDVNNIITSVEDDLYETTLTRDGSNNITEWATVAK